MELTNFIIEFGLNSLIVMALIAYDKINKKNS